MDGYVTIGTKLDTKSFEEEIKQTEQYLNKLIVSYEKTSNMKGKIKPNEEAMAKLRKEIEKTNNKLIVLREKQDALNKTNLSKIPTQLKDIGNSVENVTKKVGKWALAIFSIRSAYMLVRRSISELSNYNDELATKLSNIRLILATALEPIINSIVNAVYTLLAYINYLTKAWFGLDIFARASELSSEKMANNLKSGASSVKEMRKQLASFDEMNVLNDNTSTAGGGGVGGADTSQFEIPDVKIPKWLEWIKNNGGKLAKIISAIAGAVLALKSGLGGIKALGIGIAIYGIITAVQGLLDYLKDPSWENFGELIEGIGLTLVGIGIATGNLPLIIIGACVTIFGVVAKYWDKIKEKLQGGIDWLREKSEWVKEHFGIIGQTIYDSFVDIIQNALNWWDNLFSSIKGMFDGIIKFVKGVFSGDWKQAWEGLKDIFGNALNIMFGTTKLIFGSIWDVIKNVANTIGNIFSGIWNGIKTGAQAVWDFITGIFSAIGDFFKGVANVFIDAINWVLKQLNKLSFDVPDWIPIIGGQHWGFDFAMIPRLANGGIVNNPGPGVMMGNYIAGERGPEAVIPLDDETMDRLGENIAKHIVINANITNEMNGRIISRELHRINNESDFAYNR